MIMDRLYKAALDSPVCVGLDTTPAFLPGYLVEKDWSTGEKIAEFNKRIVDATADLAGCYKMQVACYEALGLDGMKAYAETVKYVRGNGKIAIGDCKRGDISSTATQYAKGHFEGDFEVDILTVNAYMGEDAISPYYPYLKDKEKGLFVLLHTSNPSSRDFQERVLDDDKKLYEAVGDRITAWGKDFIAESGYSAIGAVVGLTFPEEFEALQDQCPSTFFLVPGYGAQGGTGKDIANIFKKSRCAVINSSRGIIGGHQGKTEGPDFVDYIREKTALMKEDILQWL
ncbi:orotidine-5'-phosphate decarboxylase [Eubacterium aggregans]|uniref:Orotidine 5'-phosphate decarboxylase n=1 Tax=Eubacterium aggregans TaxID=81409 RepID=A0A1H4CS66_9FIRM|nr:orotidine-5'-phosphate decarboxylase [Eubacterium aggregans]SEA63216.1 orotidine-5'-phosphate decarboxylase [Eubacterium aggregans]